MRWTIIITIALVAALAVGVIPTHAQSTSTLQEYYEWTNTFNPNLMIGASAVVIIILGLAYLSYKSNNQNSRPSNDSSDVKALADVLRDVLRKRLNILVVVIIPFAVVVFGIILSEILLELYVRPWLIGITE